MPVDSKRARVVFEKARQAGDAAAVDRVLDRECAGDPELWARVLAMLDAAKNPATAPAEPPAETPATVRFAQPEKDPIERARTRLALQGVSFLELPTNPDALGRLGHYDILEVLGRGGFGIVLKGFDNSLHRAVAIKVMTPEMAATSPARKRFLREARAAAAVRHDNVVNIYAVEEEPIPYLVMEYIPGETLQQLLDRTGPLDVPTTLRLGTQVARGLAAAHATGLIHRDVTPGNILIESGPDGRARLTDFGLARAADDASLTQSGVVAGTPLYMSPEQALDEPLDHRTDLFSLGSVLYTMVSGRPPFRAANSMAVLKRVAEDTPRPIQEINSETPDWLCAVIAKLHRKNPAERFQSAREVADLLADCLAQVERQGKLTDSSRIPAPPAPPAPPPPARRPSGWKWVVAAAILLPFVVFAATEGTGVTHLFNREAKPVAAGPAKLPPAFKNDFDMELVLVGKGSFWKGGGNGRPGNEEVTIPHDFYLGAYEVTREQWETLMGREQTPELPSDDGAAAVPEADRRRLPICAVSCDDAQEFLRRLNKAAKEPGWKYRLPTSAEWEYACRGGPSQSRDDSAFDFYFARPTNALTPEKANFGDTGLKRVTKVGSYPPNRLGLYDMHGNVFEYCDDAVKEDGETLHPLRGGGWMDGPDLCQARHVNRGNPESKYVGGGFRIARVPAE
jgi:serine/threonine protein kinase